MPIIRRIPVCHRSDILPGTTRSFRFGNGHALLINDDGTLKAYVNRCTHMGGVIEARHDKTWVCRWHGATFDPHTGAALSGQAPSGSALAPIRLEEQGEDIIAILELPDDPYV